MTDVLDDPFDRKSARAAWWSRATAQGRWPQGIPELVSQVYHQAPAFLRANLLECLLKPVGPLALLAIAAGAFARFLYRLQRNAMPISIDDAARITSDHVLELARYLEQCSPDTLLRFAALIADRPMVWATISGSALLMTLNLRNRREQARPLIQGTILRPGASI